MKIEYRQAVKEDAELLIGIYNAAFYSDYLKYGECPGYGKTKGMMEESIIGYPKFIILCDNEAVGCLCVVPKHQGRGIGAQAIGFIKEHYLDWKRITLVTPVDKSENVKFYTEKCGFKIVSTEKSGNVELARFVIER